MIIKTMKKYLKDNNLSQAAFARQLGVTRQSVNSIITGGRDPSKRVMKFFGYHAVKQKRIVKDVPERTIEKA